MRDEQNKKKKKNKEKKTKTPTKCFAERQTGEKGGRTVIYPRIITARDS